MVGSQNIDAEDAFKILITGVVQPSYMGDTCTVDQDVDTGKLQDFLECRSCPDRVGKVALVRGRGSAELGDSFCCLLCGFTIQIYDANGSAMLGEAKGNRLAYTTSPACHQGHLIV